MLRYAEKSPSPGGESLLTSVPTGTGRFTVPCGGGFFCGNPDGIGAMALRPAGWLFVFEKFENWV